MVWKSSNGGFDKKDFCTNMKMMPLTEMVIIGKLSKILEKFLLFLGCNVIITLH